MGSDKLDATAWELNREYICIFINKYIYTYAYICMYAHVNRLRRGGGDA
jgi:hypothetical protein